MKAFADIRKTFFSLAAMTAVVLAAFLPARADDAGTKHLNEARLTVEKSGLTKEEKLDVLAKADRAVNAGIPPEDAAVIITRGMRQGAPAKSIADFLEVSAALKEQGLPVRLVLDRIEQGLSKGVPPSRISNVVRGLAGELALARPMVAQLVRAGVKPLQGGGYDDAVETVARALEKSISRDAILRTGKQIQERKGSLSLFDRAVDAMTSFAGAGMSVEQASRLVQTAMERGYSEKGMEKMETTVFAELKEGRSMDDIAANMESRMEREERGGGRGRIEGPMRGPGPGMGGPRR